MRRLILGRNADHGARAQPFDQLPAWRRIEEGLTKPRISHQSGNN